MDAHRATFTRQTTDKIWFVFAQENTDGEGYVERRTSSAAAGENTVVREIDPGLWYLTDATSLDLRRPPDRPPPLTVQLLGRLARFMWVPPSRFAFYDLVIGRTWNARFSGLRSSSGMYDVLLPLRTPGIYTARLEDRGVQGPTLTFRVPNASTPGTPFPPELFLQSGRSKFVSLRWNEPFYATVYDLWVQKPTGGQYRVQAFNLPSSDLGHNFVVEEEGIYRAFLQDGVVQGPVLQWIVGQFIPIPPPLTATPRLDTVSLTWIPPGINRTYNLLLGTFTELGTVGALTVRASNLASSSAGTVLRGLPAGVYGALLEDSEDSSKRGAITRFEIKQQAAGPPDLTASVNRSEVTLTWPPTVGGERYDLVFTQAGVEVLRRQVEGSAGRDRVTLADGVYGARLQNATGISNTVTFTIDTSQPPPPPPEPPTPPALSTTVTDLAVRFSWTPPAIDARYNLQLTTAGGSTFSNIATNLFSFDGFINRTLTSYGVYKARLVDSNTGKIGPEHTFRADAPPPPKPDPEPEPEPDPDPTPPTLAAAVNDLDVTLSWTPPDEPARYHLQLTNAGGRTLRTVTLTPLASSIGFIKRTSLEAGTYRARLRDADTRIEGAITTFTIAAPPEPTAKPPKLSADVNERRVRLHWTPPGVATKYNLQLTDPDGVVFFTEAFNLASSLGEYITTLEYGTYRARLVDDGALGDFVTFTVARKTVVPDDPDDPPPVEKPTPRPPSLTATLFGRRVRLTWEPPDEDTFYNMEITGANGIQFNIAARNLASGLGRYETRLTPGATYRARLTDGDTVGPAVRFTLRDFPPPIVVENLVISGAGRTVTFTWKGPPGDVYDLQITDANGSTYITRVTDVVTGSDGNGRRSYEREFPPGVYRARLTAEGLNGRSASFSTVFIPPPISVRVEGNLAVFRWDGSGTPRTFEIWMQDVTGGDEYIIQFNRDFVAQLTSIDSKLGRASVSVVPNNTYRAQLRSEGVPGVPVEFSTPPKLDVRTDGNKAQLIWDRPTREREYTLFVDGVDRSFPHVERVTGDAARAFVDTPGPGRYTAVLVGKDGEGLELKFDILPGGIASVGVLVATVEWDIASTYYEYNVEIFKFGSSTPARKLSGLTSNTSKVEAPLPSTGRYLAYLTNQHGRGPFIDIVVPPMPRVICRNRTYQLFWDPIDEVGNLVYRVVLAQVSTSLVVSGSQVFFNSAGQTGGINLVDIADTYLVSLVAVNPDARTNEDRLLENSRFWGPPESFSALPEISAIRLDLSTALLPILVGFIGPAITRQVAARAVAKRKAAEASKIAAERAAASANQNAIQERWVVNMAKKVFGPDSAVRGGVARIIEMSAQGARFAAEAAEVAATTAATAAAQAAAVTAITTKIVALAGGLVGGLVAGSFVVGLTAFWAEPQTPLKFDIVVWDKTDGEEVVRKTVDSHQGSVSATFLSLPFRYGLADRLHELQIWAETENSRGPIGIVGDPLGLSEGEG